MWSEIGILPESPRWYLFTGKIQKGLSILEDIARINNKKMPKEEDLKRLLAIIEKENSKLNTDETCLSKMGSVFKGAYKLVKTRNMRRRNLIIFYAWFVVSMIYYGLTFSGANINAPLHVNIALNGLIEIPALFVAIFSLIKFGRRSFLSMTLLSAGVACIGIIFVPTAMVWLNITLALLGKFMVSMSFLLVFIYSAELVPTNIRNISMGMASMCARIGSALAPYIVDLLGDIYYAIPSTIFGLLSILSGLLCLLLPETGDSSLPESIEQIEALPR